MVEKSHSSGLWPSVYEPLRHLGTRMAEWLAPASDARGSEDAYSITMELPGVSEKDIDISIHDGVVSVKGEKSAEREEKGDTWFFAERQYGTFSRTFRLPADADGDKVSADLKDGVLTLTVPKITPKSPESTKVKINKG
ncbi:Hsp20 family protein [Roseovarius salis]|uniref:Hsp20/alpha crystallin family protein n=1 Tax=Roseovarius salis TaxID=3376063 RepID=UPI0037C9AB95